MSMVIGKEAREAVAALLGSLAEQQAMPDESWKQEWQSILNRCTDAPEVGSAEPVAFISHTREGDVLDVQRQFDAPRVTPLYTHPPEVGLPEGWPWTSEVLERLPMTIREVSHDCGEEDWLTDPIESIARWLESAGHKEGGE